MRKFLLPLLAVLALPSTANAEKVWLIIFGSQNLSDGAGSFEKIEMENMNQCELSGAKLLASERLSSSKNFALGFECVKGK